MSVHRRRKKQEAPRNSQKILKLFGLDDHRGWGLKPLLKSWVMIHVEGTPVDFLIDTGAHHSVLKTPLGPLLGMKTWDQWATGTALCPWITQMKVGPGSKKGIPLFHGNSCLPLPTPGKRLADKNKGSNSLHWEGGEDHPMA